MAIDNLIILIDDDKDESEILQDALTHLGLDVKLIWFPEGMSAYTFLKEHEVKPLVILSDINMPGMGGLELRKKIEEDEVVRRKSIPFVFLTTTAATTAVNRAYEMSVQGFFEKPQNFNMYVQLIRQIYEYWKVCRHPNS